MTIQIRHSTVGEHINVNLLICASALASLLNFETALEDIFSLLGILDVWRFCLANSATLISEDSEQVRMSTLDFGSLRGCFTETCQSSGCRQRRSRLAFR